MDVNDAIHSRRTVRDFEQKTIGPGIVKRIIEAGLRAPTNNHLRQWEFIIINDIDTRIKVIDKIKQGMTAKEATIIIDGWGLADRCQREMYIDAIPKQYKMLLTAGCLIIPCFSQEGPLLKPRNLSALNPFASIWCCIENMLLAAASEGIQGVTRIPFDRELPHIRGVLNIPEDYEIPCYLALGYPDPSVGPIRQHAIEAEDRIHLDKW